MRVFLHGKKVNFVDENNVFLGYDIGQVCCEDAGWFVADTTREDIIEREDDTPDLDRFTFDTSFFEHVYGRCFKDGGMRIFRIVNGQSEERFIHIYNVHNGYYCHGFEFTVGGKILRKDEL